MVTGLPGLSPSTSVNSNEYESVLPRTGTDNVFATNDAQATPVRQKSDNRITWPGRTFTGRSPRYL